MINKVLNFTSVFFNVSKDDILGQKRNNEIVIARHFCWYTLHCVEGISVGQIMRFFARNRRTISRTISQIKFGIENQKYYREIYDKYIDAYKKESHT